jgi:hypothetical protein
MAVLFFSDVLKKVDIEPKDVKLIRHALSDKGFRSCYDANQVIEYTRQQKETFSNGYKYWAVFISDSGNYARFYGLYRVGNHVPATADVVPEGFPHPEWFNGESAYYELTPVEELAEYHNRLLIDWGPSAKMWHQKGTTDKPIVALRSDPQKMFPGYDDVLLTFESLKEIVDNGGVYSDWKVALSSVKGVYLISDTFDGRLYVGSAYGRDGLWGRWSEYATTGGHGNNKLLEATLKAFPDRYRYLKWSILQVLPMSTTADATIEVENKWKDRLLTREHGYNKSEFSWESEKLVLEAISLLEKIEKNPKWKEWCRNYSVYEPSDVDGLRDRLRRLFHKAYETNALLSDYQDIIERAKLDEKQISNADEGWLADVSTEELMACITYHFRRDHFAEGSLINSSVASGAMLRMLLELQKRK